MGGMKTIFPLDYDDDIFPIIIPAIEYDKRMIYMRLILTLPLSIDMIFIIHRFIGWIHLILKIEFKSKCYDLFLKWIEPIYISTYKVGS